MIDRFIDGQDSVEKLARAILTTYIICGCDQNPGFHCIGHGTGLYVCDKLLRTRVLQTHEDFFELILNIYQQKYKGLERYWDNDSQIPLERRTQETRRVIKVMKGVERETIPIVSVLKLQVRRAIFLTEFWTNMDCNLDPTRNGWRQGVEPGSFEIVLQDESDEYYYLPRHLLMGCQCRKECSGRCSCHKDSVRKVCSLITCKYCPCFNRHSTTESIDTVDSVSNSSEDTSVSTDYDNFEFDDPLNGVSIDEL